MEKVKHALIVGRQGAGKSTLIRRVTSELDRPVFGFETKRKPELADSELGDPIYIRAWGEPWSHTEKNLMGYCKNKRFQTLSGAFDRYAERLTRPVPSGSLICFDEIGFMESQEERFCRAILARLGGDIPVLAAVKHNDFPFLNAVRAHENCRCFFLTEDNREQTYREVLAFLRQS